MKALLLFISMNVSAATTHIVITHIPIEFVYGFAHMGISGSQISKTLGGILPLSSGQKNTLPIHVLVQPIGIAFICPGCLLGVHPVENKYIMIGFIPERPFYDTDYTAKIDEYTARHLDFSLQDGARINAIYEFIKKTVISKWRP